MRRFLPILPIAMLAALALPAFADDSPPQRTISIDGKGEVTTAPDTAFVDAGVTTTAMGGGASWRAAAERLAPLCCFVALRCTAAPNFATLRAQSGCAPAACRTAARR